MEQNTPLNRDICLTNKIFTYIISGLAVIATETKSQKLLLKQYPNIGKCFPIDDKNELAKLIDYYAKHTDELNNAKTESEKQAKQVLNWENESQKFINTITKVLS